LTQTPSEEGRDILHVLDKYFPKHFDGKTSIQWLHKHTTQKRQDEWAAFFFEEYCFPLLIKFLGGWKGPRITNNKRFDYQREYVWDLKLEAVRDIKGTASNWILLNDIKSTKRVIELESGIGYVIAVVDFSYDMDGKLRTWREKFEEKEGSSNTRARTLKKNGQVIDLKAIFIKNTTQIEKGLKDGWIDIFKQGRNSDGSDREPKYKINRNKIPKEFMIDLK